MAIGPISSLLAKDGWAKLAVVFAIAAAFVLVATLPTATEMARQWISSSSYHHGLFVAPIALWMIVRKSPLPDHSGRSPLSLVLFVIGAGLWLAGRASAVALIDQAGLVTLVIALTGLVFSDRALRLWAYPLAFLYFAVPFGESLIPFLQLLTAKIVVGLLTLAGQSIEIDGLLIKTGGGAFAIAKACAGFRILIACVMVAAVFAYAAFRTTTKRLAFLLFAIALALFANALRAFFLILLASLTEGRLAQGVDHFVYGWVVYLVVLIIMVLVGRRYADPAMTHRGMARPAPPPWPVLIIAGAILLGASAYERLVVRPPETLFIPEVSLSLSAEGWRTLPGPQNWAPLAPGADAQTLATFEKAHPTEGPLRVYAHIDYFTHDRPGGELFTSANRAADGDEWTRAGTHEGVIHTFGRLQERRFDILAGPDRRQLLTLTVYWLGESVYLDVTAAKKAQMKQKLSGANHPGGHIILAASFQNDPAEAMKILRQFTADLETFGALRAQWAGN